MTTVIPFIPSNLVAPSFDATFDGVEHQVVVTWNVSAQRFYVNIYTKDTGLWVITVPLISSPPARNVQDAVYDPFLNAVVVQLVDPNLWPVPLGGPITKPGTIVEYTLAEFQPPTYNGKFRSLHINPLLFTFPMPTDPGSVVVLGKVNRLLNMIDTVFSRSTMVYRNGAFEINP